MRNRRSVALYDIELYFSHVMYLFIPRPAPRRPDVRLSPAGGGGAAPSRRGETPGGDQEPGVPDHPVIRPDGEAVHMPATVERLPRRGLEEPAVAPQPLDDPRKLRRRRDVAADEPAGDQRLRRPCHVVPWVEHVEDYPVEGAGPLSRTVVSATAPVSHAVRGRRLPEGVGRVRLGARIQGDRRGELAGHQPPPRGDLPEVFLHVRAGDLGEVGARLEGDELTVGPDGPQQPAGQRA